MNSPSSSCGCTLQFTGESASMSTVAQHMLPASICRSEGQPWLDSWSSQELLISAAGLLLQAAHCLSFQGQQIRLGRHRAMFQSSLHTAA